MVGLSPSKSNERFSKIVLVSIFLVSLTCIVILANAAKGGILLYYDPYEPGYWVGVDKFYDVEPGETYSFKVCQIPPELGDIVFLKVSTEEDDEDGWTDWYEVIGEDRCIEFEWTCPTDAYYCNTFVVQLKKGVEDDPYKPKGAAYIVTGILTGEDIPAHLHVIPEYAFGTAMAITSLFSALGIYTKFRK